MPSHDGIRTPSYDGVTGNDIFTDYISLLQRPDFMQAIRDEAHTRAVRMLEGLADYQDVQIEVEATPHKAVWQKGNARLLDYGGDVEATAVLCIPSLINKHYIFDLYEERSFIAYLLKKGFRPLVLDWGEPGLREKRYDCADYIHYIARDALQWLRRHHEGEIALLGYCMGGVFATALAQIEAPLVDRLALLATPWNYHSADMPPFPLDAPARQSYKELLLGQDVVPPVWTQTLFHLLNPWHFQEKFQRFTTMSEAEKYHFVAVESWVNDGVPLARNVAKECFIDWPHVNRLATKKWSVASHIIDPSQLTCPVFFAMPKKDRIVPLGSASGLADAVRDATIITPDCGHVSMLIGSGAKKHLWQPLVKWLRG